MAGRGSNEEFDAILEAIGPGVPDAGQYRRMSQLNLDVPQAHGLAGLDPFLPAYKAAAMTLYLALRGRPGEGYIAARDESPSYALPAHLATGLVPWSFRDAAMVSEHLLAWAHILKHLNLSPGGSVLEYGPGSGQLLLMLARMGYRACGVDIDAVAIEGIRGQALQLGLPVETEQGVFGEGFAGETFDCILFYEAFHHAFDFDDLLIRLHGRLKPGGRLILCGEPIVEPGSPGVPYPWGPRLDALSVFCMRRFGWMELGFCSDYFGRIARATGWTAQAHPFPGCGRAAVQVLTPTEDPAPREAHLQETVAALEREVTRLDLLRHTLERDMAALHGSTSWRVTTPLRALKQRLAGARRGRG